MAKWGEGDPRWIVEERPDAKNVNNWHWSESDASGWSKTKLKSLLVGLEFKGSEGTCTTVEVVSCKGEATANNRKGKLIFFYEWQIKLKWTGSCTPHGEAPDPEVDDETKPKEYSGEIEIPNLSEENDIDDIDVIVTANKSSRNALQLKEMVHKLAPGIVREQLGIYLKSMREEFSKGLILPKQDSQSSNLSSLGAPRQNSVGTNLDKSSSPAARSSSSPIGCRIYTARLTLTDDFMSTVEDVFDALTKEEKVFAYTRSKAVVKTHKGGQYSILDRQITGEFIELSRPSKIVMKWRQKSWPEHHFSKVTIELLQEPTSTKLTLVQTEVPEAELERTKQGWKRYIFDSAKVTLGMGLAPL